MHPSFSPFGGLVGFVAIIVYLWGWSRIFRNAGYSGWMTLWWLVPIANVIVWVWFAFFAKWPVRTELQLLRAHQPTA